MIKKDDIKSEILNIIPLRGAMREIDLMTYLMDVYLNTTRDTFLLCISELVQSNELLRLEYILPNNAFRSIIYFPFGTKLY